MDQDAKNTRREISRYDTDRAWYAINTYSGHEDKVAEAIRQKAASSDMVDMIFDAFVPKEKQIEVKNGARKVVERKIFQGYVLVDMQLTDESWYVVRNTRGVTGFVGPGSKPIPLSDAEVKKMGVDEPVPTVDYAVGDSVRVASGPLENFVGVVEDISMEKKRVRVLVSMFGRDTPVELELIQIHKM
jgi:transcriptional antiterminator NusG